MGLIPETTIERAVAARWPPTLRSVLPTCLRFLPEEATRRSGAAFGAAVGHPVTV
ncbi:MAG: hypothetical protein ACYDGN_01685 [Acidimicrobiales bacterium]